MTFSRVIVASTVGIAMGLTTFSLEHFSWFEHYLVPLLLPGVIGSMAVAGNAHAFSLWIAAIINALFYSLIIWLLGAVLATLRRKF